MRTAFPQLHGEMQAALQHFAATQLHTGAAQMGWHWLNTSLGCFGSGLLAQLPYLPSAGHPTASASCPALVLLRLAVCSSSTQPTSALAEKAYRQVCPSGGGGILSSLQGLSVSTSDGRRTRSQVCGFVMGNAGTRQEGQLGRSGDCIA